MHISLFFTTFTYRKKVKGITMTEAEIKSVLEENEELRKQVSDRDEALANLNAELAKLQGELAYLRNKVFGHTSEKHLPLDPNQLSLFDQREMTEDEKNQLEADVAKAEETITYSVTGKARPSRKPLDESKLPVEEEHLYPEGTTDENGALKEEYTEIGVEEKKVLETVPARVFIRKIVRHKVMLKSDVRTKLPEDRGILTPALPLEPVERCIAGASVLTDIIIGKFMYHLPFYRQIQQYKEAGITVSDATMGGWYEAAVEKLKLLYDLLRKQILQSDYIHVDESVVPVIDNDKHKTRKGYEWCVLDGLGGDVMFYYDGGSRAAKVARELLGKYKGNIQSDGYGGYDQFEGKAGVTMYGCWAHARRKFAESLDTDRKRATEAIVYISKLYSVESDADEAKLTPEQRRDKRRRESYPVIRTFEKWMKDTYPTVLPKSKIGQAIEYTYALLPRLSRYVNDGRITIDNNPVERAVRPLAIGRKNWLFCGNDASAYRAAIVYSLIGTCKNADIDPRIWMEDVLKQIPYYRRDGRDLSDLLPRNWKSKHEQSEVVPSSHES